jgi:thiamine biosynthesis lipoprotein
LTLPGPLVTALLLALAPASPRTTVERETYLMGTTLQVSVEAPDRAAGIEAIEAAFEAVRGVDALLSTWREDSEISRLNHAPAGRPVALSAGLAALLREASEWSRATGGAFDPAVGALVDAWDLRGEGRIPSAGRLAAARAATGLGRFALARPDGTALRRDSSAWLDTGGFGQGVALREAARALRARGVTSGLLNFGGQVLALGDNAGGGWIVPVAHPSQRTRETLRLTLRDCSASTSSQSERWVAVDGRRVGHVLDPRTGEPVLPWGSVTVVAQDPAVADMLSTALLVLGPDAGMRWAEGRTDIGVLFLVERDGRVMPRWNRALDPILVNQSTVSRRG